METATVLFYEHPSKRFAIVYTARKSDQDIKRLARRLEVAASKYRSGVIDVLPVNETSAPDSHAFILLPSRALRRKTLERVMAESFFKGTDTLVTTRWIYDAQRAGEALEIAKKLLKAQP